jgi:hypothetical protein
MGWEFEEMDRNVELVRASDSLRAGARELAARSAGMANALLERELAQAAIERGGRKASA